MSLYEEDWDVAPPLGRQPMASTSNAGSGIDSTPDAGSSEVFEPGEKIGRRSLEGEGAGRRSRACQGCRKQKMRCLVPEPLDGEPVLPCKRCAAVGRECVFLASMRGRNRTAKTNVAATLKSLEASLQNVISSLSTKSPVNISSTDSPPSPPEHGDEKRRGSATNLLHEVRSVSPRELERTSAGQDGERRTSTIGRAKTSETVDAMLLLHGLPHPDLTPLGLLAETSLQNQNKRSAHAADLDDNGSGSSRGRFGVANARYYSSGQPNPAHRRAAGESQSTLGLLLGVIINEEELKELFALYYKRCYPLAPICDPVIHTLAGTAARSPFLLICMCTVAARYYTKRTDDFHGRCLAVAKTAAADIIIRGLKSVEIVIGLFLITQWNQPAERFSEEISYAFAGMGIHMALDLNLHCKSLPCPLGVSAANRAAYIRETRSGERAWMYAYMCDRIFANQLGKPYSISRDDWIIRNSDSWHLQTGALHTDINMSGGVALHKIVSQALDCMYSDMRSKTGLNENLDYPRLMRSVLGQLDGWLVRWTSDTGLPDTFEFLHSYYRLFLLSFAVQHALTLPDPQSELSQFSMLCFESASKVIMVAATKMEPSGSLRHAINGMFVFVAYAGCFLLKMVNPIFSDFVDPRACMSLVERGAQVLERVATDATHAPAIYACFLRNLIKSRREARSGAAPSTRAGSPVPEQYTGIAALGGMETPGIAYHGSGALSSDLDLLGGEELDALLNGPGSFWDNMLMPDFGDPLHGTPYPFAPDPWEATGQVSSESPFGGGGYGFDHNV